MLAMFTMMMLTMLSNELMYETNVEMIVSSQAVNQVRAKYAAKAGLELSLLRLHAYRQAVAIAGKMIPESMLNVIWQFPLPWPLPVPEEMSAVDKDLIHTAVKDSLIQGQFFVSIESEGSKIDINDLGSPSKIMAQATRDQLLQIISSKLESDDEFARRYQGYDFESLMNNLADWVDADTESRGSGDESAIYGLRGSPTMPPNQPFKSLEELHMVEGMTDEIFQLLAPQLTIYGAKGLNVNYAPKEVLMSLSPQITEDRADQIIKDREDASRGHFKDLSDFTSYLNTIGISGNPFVNSEDQPTVPLAFGPVHNFRIMSTGRSGKVTREITAVTYDYENVKKNLKSQLLSEYPPPKEDENSGKKLDPDQEKKKAAKKQAKESPPPMKRPTIVYWNER